MKVEMPLNKETKPNILKLIKFWSKIIHEG